MTMDIAYGTTVDVTGLRVRYGRRTALDDLDLELGPGVHGLLGPNGAGKTTLMRVLATVARPDQGRVRLLGHDVTPGRSGRRPVFGRGGTARRLLSGGDGTARTPLSGGDGTDSAGLRQVRRQLGYLPQTFGYYPRFTVREFVEYVAWLKELPRADVPLAVERALDRVGLRDRAGDRMKHLSGGMLRRAGIAQAIVNDPGLLLLDEPTAGLDPEQRVEFRTLLRELGVDACVLVSTHLVEDVGSACSRVSLLDGGRLAFTGTTGELLAAGEEGGGSGDSAIERGYSAVLRVARSVRR